MAIATAKEVMTFCVFIASLCSAALLPYHRYIKAGSFRSKHCRKSEIFGCWHGAFIWPAMMPAGIIGRSSCTNNHSLLIFPNLPRSVSILLHTLQIWSVLPPVIDFRNASKSLKELLIQRHLITSRRIGRT